MRPRGGRRLLRPPLCVQRERPEVRAVEIAGEGGPHERGELLGDEGDGRPLAQVEVVAGERHDLEVLGGERLRPPPLDEAARDLGVPVA